MAGRSQHEDAASTQGRAAPNRDEDFLTHRGLVFAIAYDITGTVADAEDVVQETYLRFTAVQDPVANPRAYLARTAARQALNALRASARRREDYVGDWLPVPLRTGSGERTDPQLAALTAAEVSTAMLVLMQNLSGPERAGFVLREVFGFDYSEIAAALDASEAAARQLVHRARDRVRAGKPKSVPDKEEHRAAVERFLEAAMTGQVQALLDVLAPDVVLLSDGGGKVSAARRPVYGPDKVAALLLGLAGKYGAGAVPEFLELNGLPAVAFREDSAVTTVFQISTEGGKVSGVYAMRNPDKLVGLQ